MQCFLVGTDGGEVQTALSSLADDIGSSFARKPNLMQLREDQRFLEAEHPLVVMSDVSQQPSGMDDAIPFAQEICGRGFLVCVADTIAPGDYKRLVKTGAADWMTVRDCRDELRDLVARLSTGFSGQRTAKVLSFVPSKGGVGNTTLVVEVAIHLASRRKRNALRVAILDLNLQGGTVADALDLEPRFDVMEFVDRPERLDEQLIDIFKSRHSKTLDVFASRFSHIGLEAIQPDVVFTFIDAIASRYDAILFDLPVQWLTWTDNLLLGSDAVIVSGADSVPGLRRLAATLGRIDALGIPEKKVSAVVNMVDTDFFGRVSRRAVIDRALAQRRTFFIQRDNQSAGSALDVGRPLLQLVPNSKIAKNIRRLAEWLEETVDAPQKAPSSRPALLKEAAA